MARAETDKVRRAEGARYTEQRVGIIPRAGR